jgi:hypothetical protein
MLLTGTDDPEPGPGEFCGQFMEEEVSSLLPSQIQSLISTLATSLGSITRVGGTHNDDTVTVRSSEIGTDSDYSP